MNEINEKNFNKIVVDNHENIKKTLEEIQKKKKLNFKT